MHIAHLSWSGGMTKALQQMGQGCCILCALKEGLGNLGCREDDLGRILCGLTPVNLLGAGQLADKLR